ncbi:MAG: transcriptional regulator [Thermoprotei archaeon]|nr:transcriptional regulator [Thermoprotei archaeon]
MASKDQLIGALIFVGSLLGIALYFWLVFLSAWDVLILKITAFVAISAVLGIVAWVGWTMSTTPPPEEITSEIPELSSEPEEEEKKEEESKPEEKTEGQGRGSRESSN